MNEAYVLIVFLFGRLTMQDFTSLQNCQTAAKAITYQYERTWSGQRTPRDQREIDSLVTMCVHK